MIALEQSLKHEDLLNLMPKTNFMSAITTIELWENSYPETYRKFGESIDVNIDEFILSLKEFDVLAYEHFNELFPKLTSGAIFNPFVNVDVVELYEDVANKLKEYGYNGIYIIYDEFSKYLESSIDNATISDIKLLQDFAEKCDRSGEQQMHLMLISHKDISNYIDNKLPKEKVDGWRGVSGRFKHINLHNNFSQMYEIMATVIKKDNKFWSQFTEKNKICFRSLMDRYKENNLFDNFDLNTAIMDCYPLHPISTFILPRLSEKVAQNERTLFTFLSSDNKYTLNEFLRKSNTEFPILTPDYIYDYFEPLFRKEIYTSDIYKIYSLTSKVLRRLENDSLSSKIIKTIALIYMVEQFEKLPPTHSMIVDAYIETVPDILEINNTLKELIEKDCIVYLKRSNGYLKIKESSGVDIFSEIKKVIEKNEENISVKKILNETHLDSYMYPTAYNDEMEITRYFDFKFIDSEEFYAVENWERKIESFDSVGVVYAIIPKDLVDIKNIRANITSDNNGHSRLLFVLPKTFIDIGKIVYEYYAVEQLKTNAVDDEMLFDEYDIILEDLEEVISKFIGRYTRPEMNESEYFYKGKKMPFKRKAHISTKLSEICYETYPHTPVINNETINKDIITTAALNSRNKVISGLLENNLDVNLGLRGTGQDISFMRSTLIRTGILLDEEKNPKLTLSPSDDKIRKLLIIIQNFFTESSNVEGKNFKELYDMLILPQYGYGIKKGVIPIYIAVVMHSFKKYMVVKTKDNEINISVDLLNSINETPEKFTVYLEDWSEEKTNYIEMLSELFSDYIIEREKDYNTFSYVVFAMSRWYMDLPKYARTLKAIYKGKNASGDLKLSKSQMKFINSLKNPDINAREYLFKDLVKIFDYSEFSINIVDNLKSAKLQFDNAKTELIKQLIIDVKIIFSRTSNNINASLSSVIKDYIESLKSQTLIHLYPNGEDKILSLMKTISNDEVMFIERLGKAVTDLRINDWNRETVTIFITELESFKKSIEEFDRNVTISNINTGNNTQGYKISFLDENGNEIVKTFDKIEYSNRAKLLYNEIANALEEMGQSISEGEKRQILMAFIEKMC